MVAEVTNFVRKTEVTTKMNKINISDVVILSKKTELVAVESKVNNISNEQVSELLKKADLVEHVTNMLIIASTIDVTNSCIDVIGNENIFKEHVN